MGDQNFRIVYWNISISRLSAFVTLHSSSSSLCTHVYSDLHNTNAYSWAHKCWRTHLRWPDRDMKHAPCRTLIISFTFISVVLGCQSAGVLFIRSPVRPVFSCIDVLSCFCPTCPWRANWDVSAVKKRKWCVIISGFMLIYSNGQKVMSKWELLFFWHLMIQVALH